MLLSPRNRLQAPAGKPNVHTVTFERNVYKRDLWRAQCSCGWVGAGAEAAVKGAAAGHDIDWETVGQFEAAALRRDARR